MTDQPGDHRPVGVPQDRMLPIKLPHVVNGFRFARIADGADEHNRPVVSPERGWIHDMAERRFAAEYLRGGAVVMMVGGLGLDVFEPERGEVAPLGSRTDGEWIWSDSVPFYLVEHGVAPEPELYRRVLENAYRCPPVPPERLVEATAALQERYRLARELRRRAEEGDGER